MRRVFVFATALLAVATIAPPAAADPTADLTVRLDAAIEARVAEMGVPGAVVSLSIPGQIDYVRAVGVSDTATAAPMSIDEHTRIGSVTKTFTGTAVLQLVDQGRIRLSDPISLYVDGVPSGDAITLDLLGRMRSGLADYTESDVFMQRLYAESPAGPDAFATTPRELVDWALSQPLKFPPGSQYEYSNTNTALLGMVIEKVGGLSLADYLQQNIFGPLRLTRTSFPGNGVMPDPYAHGYNETPGGAIVDATLWNPSWAYAAGEIVSSEADLRTWAAALGTGALLSPSTQAQRLSGGTTVVAGVDYAFAVFNAGGWIGHNGDIPGYTTVMVYLPQRDATLVVSVNSDVPKLHAAGQLATDITSIATPDHVYQIGPRPPELIEN